MVYTMEHFTLMNARRRAAWVREHKAISRILEDPDECMGLSSQFVEALRRQANMIDRRLSVQ